MMGLAVLGALAVYGLIGFLVVRFAARRARRRGIAGWKWGLPAGLVVYFLVFQDHLPSLLVHAYQCNLGDAGFRVYKTVEEWREENPGVWETLAPDALPEEHLVKTEPTAGGGERRHYRLPDGTRLVASFWKGGKLISTRLVRPDGSEGYWLNQRITSLDEERRNVLSVYRRHEKILDRETALLMAEYVDYRLVVRLPAFVNLAIREESCEEDVKSRIAFANYQKHILNKESEDGAK